MFERFDTNNNPHNTYVHEKWYGKKEVPNVALTLCENTFKDEPNKTIYFDTIRKYYEEYDNEKGWKIVLDCALMSPSLYEIITNSKYKVFYVQIDNYWRNMNNGEDEGYIEPRKTFNRMSIKHKLEEAGEFTDWYITLWNEPSTPIPISKKSVMSLEDVKL